jgi:hypothetical protein
MDASLFGAAAWPSKLAQARVILDGQESESAGTGAAAPAGVNGIAAGELPKWSVPDNQPSCVEMTAYLDRISPFAKDSEQSREFQRYYVDAWNRCLEQNLVEIEEGDKQGVGFYYYQVDQSDLVCRGHLLQKTFVTRTQIRAFPQVVPPFHLGCSCMIRRYLFVPDFPADRGFSPLVVDDEIPVLPAWNERAEVSAATVNV